MVLPYAVARGGDVWQCSDWDIDPDADDRKSDWLRDECNDRMRIVLTGIVLAGRAGVDGATLAAAAGYPTGAQSVKSAASQFGKKLLRIDRLPVWVTESQDSDYHQLYALRESAEPALERLLDRRALGWRDAA